MYRLNTYKDPASATELEAAINQALKPAWLTLKARLSIACGGTLLASAWTLASHGPTSKLVGNILGGVLWAAAVSLFYWQDKRNIVRTQIALVAKKACAYYEPEGCFRQGCDGNCGGRFP